MAANIDNSDKLFANNTVWYGVGIVDYLNTGAIYTGYLTATLKAIFLSSLQFAFFPLYALTTNIYAVLGVLNLIFDRDKETGGFKKENIIRVVVNVFSAVIVTVAVVGALAFSAMFGIGATLLFAANLAVTGIYNFSGAGYHFYQYRKKGQMLADPSLATEDRERLAEERSEHKTKAIGYLLVGATIAMVGIAGALSVLGGIMPLAAIGIVAGVIGAAFCVYAIVKSVRDRKQKALEQTGDVVNSDGVPGVSIDGIQSALRNSREQRQDKVTDDFEHSSSDEETSDAGQEWRSVSEGSLLLGPGLFGRNSLPRGGLSDGELVHSPSMTNKQ